MTPPVLTVGIGGGTGAGKTSLCEMLSSRLGSVSLLDLDSYYLDRSGLSPAERATLNFDEPAAFDLALLLEHLHDLRYGRPIAKPCYSFEDHLRVGSSVLEPASVVLVEGLFALWWKEVRDLLDLRVYVDAPEPTRLSRRLARDVATRGRTPESVRRQFRDTVSPMHGRYVEPTRSFADLVLANDRELTDAVDLLAAALRPTNDRGRPARVG
jgi:uridine kinase